MGRVPEGRELVEGGHGGEGGPLFAGDAHEAEQRALAPARPVDLPGEARELAEDGLGVERLAAREGEPSADPEGLELRRTLAGEREPAQREVRVLLRSLDELGSTRGARPGAFDLAHLDPGQERRGPRRRGEVRGASRLREEANEASLEVRRRGAPRRIGGLEARPQVVVACLQRETLPALGRGELEVVVRHVDGIAPSEAGAQRPGQAPERGLGHGVAASRGGERLDVLVGEALQGRRVRGPLGLDPLDPRSLRGGRRGDGL